MEKNLVLTGRRIDYDKQRAFPGIGSYDMKSYPVRLILGLCVGVVAVSCASIFIRFAQAQGMGTLVTAAWRLVFACLVLLPYAWIPIDMRLVLCHEASGFL